jgi:L-lactate permease
MVAPAKVLVACATPGLQGREGEVMRLTLKYCLALIFITSLIGWLVLL